jgi:ADP-heptose:LPS heptosyltransferase
MTRVLVIKLGALGDFIMAQPALQAIRKFHAADELSLLTIPALTPFARASGLFQQVIEDPRAPPPGGYWRMSRWLRRQDFDFVYDLQGNTRTAWYWRLCWPARPAWAGPVAGCSHPRPARPIKAHRMEWYAAQLRALGIEVPDVFQLDWLHADTGALNVPAAFALLVPGGSAHRPAKRWPVAHYIEVARELVARDITPVLIGTTVDADAIAAIGRAVGGALDLTGRTSIPQLASLARVARGALGNDTGPMHVVAAVGCPSITLFSRASDPEFIAPRGPRSTWLQADDLTDVAPADVLATVDRCWSR